MEHGDAPTRKLGDLAHIAVDGVALHARGDPRQCVLVALHQYGSVPAFPASHGCVRMPAEEAEMVWRNGQVGTRVWVTYDNRVVRLSARTLKRRALERRKIQMLKLVRSVTSF